LKLLIAGAGTPIGKDLIHLLKQQEVAYCLVPDRLLSNPDPLEMDKLLLRHRPDQLINLHAFKAGTQTAVERAETAKDECMTIHRDYTRVLVNLAERQNMPLLQLSTCYVFDGEKRLGYNEQDEPAPVGVYGRTALRGERETEKLERHVIIRIGWLFGRHQHDVIRSWIRRSPVHPPR